MTKQSKQDGKQQDDGRTKRHTGTHYGKESNQTGTITTTRHRTATGGTMERHGRRDENEPAELSNSFSSPIQTEEPSYPIHHPHRAVFTSSPQTAGEGRGTQMTPYHSYEMRKPDKRVGK